MPYDHSYQEEASSVVIALNYKSISRKVSPGRDKHPFVSSLGPEHRKHTRTSCHLQAQDARHARFDESRQEVQRSHHFGRNVADQLLQCDETRPICQRCTKSRRICLGTDAVKQACFSIHLENHYASGQVKRPRGPRSSLSVIRPQFDLQTRALTYYLQDHLQTSSDVQSVPGGLSQCVSAWKVSGKTCHMVDLALSSISLAVFSRTQQHPPAAVEASSKYCRLLRITQERVAQLNILSLDGQNINAYLLAAFLMGRHEGITHHPGRLKSKDSFKSLQSWSHEDGAMAIMKAWYDDLGCNTTTDIVKQTRRELIRSSLLRNLSLPDWMLDGTHFGEHGLELDYDRIIVRTTNFYHAFMSLQQNNCLQVEKAKELNDEARELDKALQDWVVQIPSTCSFQRHILTELNPLPRRYFYSPTVYRYSTPEYATVWGQYFATRMLINSTRLKVLKMSRPSPVVALTYKQQRLECVLQLKGMADSLASTIPFCLQRFKADDSNSSNSQITINTNEDIKPYLANTVVWPLTIASSIEGIDAGQKLWFRSELASLGRLIGHSVLECAETNQWATL